jgi:translation initiation factor IF-2
MSIRLSKAIKEFNVGQQTIVDFLNANGAHLTGDLNEKIDDNMHELLQQHFGADRELHKQAAQIFNKPEKAKKVEKPAEAETPQVAEAVVEPTKPEAVAVVKAEVVETAPTVAPVEAVAEKETQTKEPKAKKAKPEEPKGSILTEGEDGVFKLKPQTGVAGPVVLGTIDLEALNQNTRPKKKSREEKKKEREEKNKQQRNNGNNKGQNNPANAQGNEKRKRQRIGKERVDINEVSNQPSNNAKKNANAAAAISYSIKSISLVLKRSNRRGACFSLFGSGSNELILLRFFIQIFSCHSPKIREKESLPHRHGTDDYIVSLTL